MLHEAVRESIGDLRQYLGYIPWVAETPSVDASEAYCRSAAADVLVRKHLPYWVFDRTSDRLVACAGLVRPDWSLPKLEVGYWCRSSEVGKGYITEAVSALVDFAELTLGAVRLELLTDEENHRSRAVALRTGFQLEGILRNERRTETGELRNTCMYSRVRFPR